MKMTSFLEMAIQSLVCAAVAFAMEYTALAGDESPANSGQEAVVPAASPEVKGTPKIVSMTPAVGAKDVDPATSEIVVKFDRDMAQGFSWTGGGASFPPPAEGQKPLWRDARTAVLPVKLEAGRYYRVGINSKSHRNFRSTDGMPARPAVIYFTTKGAGTGETEKVQVPEIVELRPANGAEKVDPKLAALSVTFNMPMGGSYSWTGGGTNFPALPEGKGAYWSEDKRTCILPVRLEPNHSYRLGLNSPSHKNFQSASGVPLDPVVYTFRTGE